MNGVKAWGVLVVRSGSAPACSFEDKTRECESSTRLPKQHFSLKL